MSATPADKHCESSVAVVQNGVVWLHQAHNFTQQLLRRHPRRGIAGAKIQLFFELRKKM